METKTTTELVDDGSRRDRKGRMRWPRERREELLGEYDRSDMSQAAFARRAGVRYPTFAHWVQARRRRGERIPTPHPSATPTTPRFVELRLPTPPASSVSAMGAELSVTLPDGVVVRGAEPSALAALVLALRAGEA